MTTQIKEGKYYSIISPSGKIHSLFALDIYHAISIVTNLEHFKYIAQEYFKANHLTINTRNHGINSKK